MDLIDLPDFKARVERLLEELHIPGLALALVQNEATKSSSYGYASIEAKKECTADTLFDIASLSKALTAASVGLFVSDEKFPEVQYDATVSSLLPDDFAMASNEYTDGVTLDDILSHRTGLAGHDLSYLGIRAEHPDTPKSVTRNMRNLATVAPIRSTYIYCNMMYTVASFLVEKLSGVDFPDFLEERFFRPLGMNSSNLQPARARARGLGDRIATGYEWNEKEGKHLGFQGPDTPEGQGAGSIITSVNDYIKFIREMMNHENVLTQDIYDGLLKPRMALESDYSSLPPYTSLPIYGAGWAVQWYRGYMLAYHSGRISGFSSIQFFLSEFKFGTVLFANSGSAILALSILTRELIDHVLGVPEPDRVDWTKVERELRKSDDDEDAEAIRKRLCPEYDEPQPLGTPLETYIGEYEDIGYHKMKVVVKDGQLFIDAMDRSVGFTVTFEHACCQTKFVAHFVDEFEGNDIPFMAEFVIEDGRAVSMGLDLDEDVEGYIWFDRTEA